MRILHISDTHGLIPRLDLDGIEAVVHSGDFLPNKTRGGNSYNVSLETEFQRDWTARNFDDLMEMVPDPIPLLICRGNHDFINPSEYLGVNARDLSGQLVEVCGIKFFGFPFTPWLAGEWWGELTLRQEEHAMEGLLLVLERDKPDVLVSHGPMHGVLDRNRDGVHCGSTKLRKLLMHTTKHLPKVMLHGHIHEHAGKTMMTSTGRDMHVFNSATIVQTIDIT